MGKPVSLPPGFGSLTEDEGGAPWAADDAGNARPSRPLPPPPKPPDFGSLAPRLGTVSRDDADWGEDEDPTGNLGMPPVRPAVASSPAVRATPLLGGAARRPPTQLVAIAVAALVVVGGILAFAFWPRSGRLVVNVTGPGGVGVAQLSVLVDGEEVCQSSPCVARLSADTHRLRIFAAGYQQPADRMVAVPRGGDANVDVALAPGGFGAGGTGLSIGDLGKYLRVKVDGQDRGALPVKINDLAAGEHVIEIGGNDRYAPFEEKVTLEADQILEYEPKLQVKKGLARVEEGRNAGGARVTLECPGEAESLLDPPTSVDVDPKKPCTLRAVKEGYAVFRTSVAFDDGKAEKVFRIDLDPTATGGTAATPRRGGASTPAAPAAASRGTCKVSINSIPITTAVIDGRPVGKTPKLVSVPCGPHTVTFMHPSKGRKVAGVVAVPSKVAVAAVRF
jgi:hypothetical protein